MVLSDTDIHKYIAQGKIKITPPLPPEQFGSCSVDFRLGHEFSVFEHSRRSAIGMNAASAPYLLASSCSAWSREHCGPVTPAGHGSSTGAAISCVSSGVSLVVAGRMRSCARERSGPATTALQAAA